MLIARSWFLIGVFFLLVGPFFLPKLFWVLASRRAMGKVLFTGGTLDPIEGTRKYLVMQFPLGKDNIEFQSNLYFGWPEDTAVAVRYSRFDPYDARIDLPVCIWGDTLVNVLLPLGIWLVLLLTPNRFDPLVPWGAKVRLGGRWPWIRVIALLLLFPMAGRAQSPKKDTAVLKKAITSNQHVNLNFNHAFHRPGATLSADADYIAYHATSSQLFLNNNYDSQGLLRSIDNEQAALPSRIHIYTAKTDYTLPLKPGLRLETGAKYSRVSSDNTADYNYLPPDYPKADTLTPDYGKTNHFLYTEQIDAAYGSLSREWRSLSVQGRLT